MRADRRVRRLLGVTVTCLTLGATACGASPSLSATAAPLLQKDATALASAARAGNRTAIAATLATLRADVAHQRAAGEVSAARSTQILDAADRVAADAPAPSTPSPRPPTPSGASGSATTHTSGQVVSPAVVPPPTRTTSAPAPPPGNGNGDGNGNGNGRGKGKGKGPPGDR